MTKCDLFIIPNSLGTVNEFIIGKERHAAEFKKLGKMNYVHYEESDPLVQVWATNDESDNLDCHGFKVNGIRCRFPTYLPAAIFNGKKEGDKVYLKLDLDGVIEDFEITLNQLDYRYCRFGTFEQTLSNLMDRFNARPKKEAV